MKDTKIFIFRRTVDFKLFSQENFLGKINLASVNYIFMGFGNFMVIGTQNCPMCTPISPISGNIYVHGRNFWPENHFGKLRSNTEANLADFARLGLYFLGVN